MSDHHEAWESEVAKRDEHQALGAAEREHCLEIARHIGDFWDFGDDTSDEAADEAVSLTVQTILRERKAAADAARAEKARAEEEDRVRWQLAAYEEWHRENGAALAEAHAEIERLRAQIRSLEEQEVGVAVNCYQHEKAAVLAERERIERLIREGESDVGYMVWQKIRSGEKPSL